VVSLLKGLVEIGTDVATKANMVASSKNWDPAKWVNKDAEGLGQQKWRARVQSVSNKLKSMQTPGVSNKQ
jgi:hypothetical protein